MTGALGILVADQGGEAPAAVISSVGALLGVVVGGFLTATLESVRQRRQEERLERAAGRLLSDELAHTRDTFIRIANDRIVRRAAIPGKIASWDQYREFLASRMTGTEWSKVARAVLATRNLCGELEQLAASDVGVGQFSAEFEMKLKQTAETLDGAVSLLAPREQHLSKMHDIRVSAEQDGIAQLRSGP
jgi:hypothetical protein